MSRIQKRIGSCLTHLYQPTNEKDEVRKLKLFWDEWTIYQKPDTEVARQTRRLTQCASMQWVFFFSVGFSSGFIMNLWHCHHLSIYMVSQWGASDTGTSQQRLERARSLFDESIQRYCDGDELLKPSSSHFNTLAHVIALSDNPDKELLVLSLFQVMEKLGCEPCIVTFNILWVISEVYPLHV